MSVAAQERLGIMFWIVNPIWLWMIPAATAIAFKIWPSLVTVGIGAALWFVYAMGGLIWILSRGTEDNEHELDQTDGGP